jgi:hypothetical protein
MVGNKDQIVLHLILLSEMLRPRGLSVGTIKTISLQAIQPEENEISAMSARDGGSRPGGHLHKQEVLI